MSDADWQKAQTQPLQGEGDHFRAKKRIKDVLRRSGFYTELEHRLCCDIIGYDEPVELRIDIYAISPDRVICVEVNGPGGHKTKQASNKDSSKKRLICEQHKVDPELGYFVLWYKDIIGRKAWTDKEIAEEMRIDTLDKPNRKWI